MEVPEFLQDNPSPPRNAVVNGPSCLHLDASRILQPQGDGGTDSSSHLCRKAWSHFIKAVLAVVEDARQIYNNNPAAFTSPDAHLLDVNQHQHPPLRLDVWWENRLAIPVKQVTNRLVQEDRAKIEIESKEQDGFVTRRLTKGFTGGRHPPVGNQWRPDTNELRHVITEWNDNLQNQTINPCTEYAQNPHNAGALDDTHFVKEPAARLKRHRPANNPNARVKQPATDVGMTSRAVIRDLMYCWADPCCPMKEAQEQNPVPTPQMHKIDPLRGSCGPHINFYKPDVSIVATESPENVTPDHTQPNQVLIAKEAGSTFKVPILIIEIVGKRDDWHLRNNKAKSICQATYALQFAPAAYVLMVWKTEISIIKVERNAAKKRLDVTEEIIDLNPESYTQAPTTTHHEFTAQSWNRVGMPSTDLSLKFQYLALKIVNIVLDMASFQPIILASCKDLRYPTMMPNNQPIPGSDAWRYDQYQNQPQFAAQLAKLPAAPRARGFRPIVEQTIWVAQGNAPSRAPGPAAPNVVPRQELPIDEEEKHLTWFSDVDSDILGTKKCYDDGEGCFHIDDLPQMLQKGQDYANSITQYDTYQ